MGVGSSGLVELCFVADLDELLLGEIGIVDNILMADEEADAAGRSEGGWVVFSPVGAEAPFLFDDVKAEYAVSVFDPCLVGVFGDTCVRTVSDGAAYAAAGSLIEVAEVAVGGHVEVGLEVAGLKIPRQFFQINDIHFT